MQYLVVGGAGFIGSNLVRSLVGRGHTVTVIDNFHTGAMRQLSGPDGKLLTGVDLHSGDAQDVQAIDFYHLDGIFYTNGPSSSPFYRAHPDLVGKTVNDFLAVLATAARYGCKLVFASSSSVYNGSTPPWHEEMPLFARDYYAEVRIAFERLAAIHHDFHGTKSAALRLFSVYGPHERPKGVFANLVSQAIWAGIEEKVFEIYGDGEQARDYTYVDDVVRAFTLAMTTQAATGIFNIGTGRSVTLNATLDIIDAQLKARGLAPIRRKYIPNPVKNYVSDTLANTAKAEAQLGFKAEVMLEDGIARVLDATLALPAALDKSPLPA